MAANAGVIIPAENPRPSFIERVTARPGLSIAVAILIAVVLGYIYSKVRGSGAKGTSNLPGTSEGLPTTDASGNPVYYVPTSNTFAQQLNYDVSGNQTITQNQDVDDTHVHNAPGTPVPPPHGPPQPPPNEERGESDETQDWEDTHRREAGTPVKRKRKKKPRGRPTRVPQQPR